MNTKILLVSCATCLGFLGLAATFLPEEILSLIDIGPSIAATLLVQVLGSLYLAFAMLNWMVRENVIGGIYGRPVSVANLIHFSIAALSLIKKSPGSTILLVVTIAYSTFALLFGILIYRHPVRRHP